MTRPVDPRGAFPAIARWWELAFPVSLSLIVGLLLSAGWKSDRSTLFLRTLLLGLIATLLFRLLGRWPRRLPRWLARWVVQVFMVGLIMPCATFAIYVVSTPAGAPPFWRDEDRVAGFLALTVVGLLVAPWAALVALVRQKDVAVRRQALEFELERSELERRELLARLHVLHAHVAPHFLFNTLANVQALVDAGSPKASTVLRSLIAYLRAAVPLLDEPLVPLGVDVELVRAYLEVMHMRMPDRLRYELHVDPAAVELRCPPATLLTLVENAVRHGIDPSEEGGRIDIHVERRGDRCTMRVIDTGVGLRETGEGLGTGLAALRERLRLMFGDDAQLRVTSRPSGGVAAEVEIPASGGVA